MTSVDKLEIGRVGETLTDVSDLLTYLALANDGWGLPDIERLTERGPLQDGVTDRGFRLSPRILTLRLAGLPDDYDGLWDLRDNLLELLKPTETPLIIRRTVAGRVREGLFHLIAGGRFSSDDSPGQAVAETLQFMAPDPILYDPTLLLEVFGVGAGSGGFVFPLAFDTGVEFGSSTVNETRAINYTGSWKEYPVIIIRGPIDNAKIVNEASGDKLDFTGLSLGSGETRTIDTRYDQKTVIDELGANAIADLTADSDLATFALLPNPEAPAGVNNLTVTGSAADATTEIFIQYYRRYIGM